MIQIRYFPQVMREGQWCRLAVCATLAEAEAVADAEDADSGRAVRVVSRRSRAKVTHVGLARPIGTHASAP
jgi:hypothetical protein